MKDSFYDYTFGMIGKALRKCNELLPNNLQDRFFRAYVGRALSFDLPQLAKNIRYGMKADPSVAWIDQCSDRLKREDELRELGWKDDAEIEARIEAELKAEKAADEKKERVHKAYLDYQRKLGKAKRELVNEVTAAWDAVPKDADRCLMLDFSDMRFGISHQIKK